MKIDFGSQVMTFGFGSLVMAGDASVNKISSNKRPISGMPSNDTPYAAMAAAPSQTPNVDTNFYSSTPRLSLTLTSGLDSKGEMIRGSGETGKNKVDDEYESRSGSDNVDGNGSGDDQDDNQPQRKKPYHRHTPQQIQEMEAFFKEYPHPDEKQRQQLSKKLHLAPRQIKFWFQNRRTQMKAQQERHENASLRDENERLRMENLSIRDLMAKPPCCNCGAPAMLRDITSDEQQLRLENLRLKDELEKVRAITGKWCGRPFPQMASQSLVHNASLGLTAVSAGLNNLDSLPSAINPTSDFLDGLSAVDITGRTGTPSGIDKNSAAGLAFSSMNELIRLAQLKHPYWISSPHDGMKETLNYDQYLCQFPRGIGPKPLGYKIEADRYAGPVLMNGINLAEMFMDANRYADMFPSIISRATTLEVLSHGLRGSRNGELQLMYMELHVLSPLGPTREFCFLRFCQQYAAGIWAVVDVSIDNLMENPNPSLVNCRRRPSGCIIQELPNNCSNVTWIEHIEYDDRIVHNLYRSLVSSGMAFGSQRWLSTLQRQCERLAVFMEINVDTTDPRGRNSLLKLAQRMTSEFCISMSASTVNNWATLSGSGDEDIRVSTRKNINMETPEMPGRVVLCAATSIWLPVTPQKSFDFLRDERRRSQWDMLFTPEPKQEIARIMKGQYRGNSVILLASTDTSMNQTAFILQECSTDACGFIIVYAPVDIPSVNSVMHGGDPDYVAVLPSGFVILPDGLRTAETGSNSDSMHRGGSILTIAFQLVSPNIAIPRPAIEDVQTVQRLISYTVQKIKAALILDSA